MTPEFLTKMQAIAIINIETGYGRRVIEKTLDSLRKDGRITITPDFDGRSLRISKIDVDFIIKYLKHEVE